MSNLINSIVRGFGSQIGRTAANKMMYSQNKIANRNQWIIALILLLLFIGLIVWAYYEGSKDLKAKSNNIEVNTKVSKAELNNIERYNGHQIFTGKRGGKYYYSKSGKKVYL